MYLIISKDFKYLSDTRSIKDAQLFNIINNNDVK